MLAVVSKIEPARPERPMCKSCAAFEKTGIDVGECHAQPPQAIAVPQQTAMGVNINVIGAFPPTKPTNWCEQWRG